MGGKIPRRHVAKHVLASRDLGCDASSRGSLPTSYAPDAPHTPDTLAPIVSPDMAMAV